VRVLNVGSGTDRAPQKIWPDAKHVSVDLDPDSGADILADVRTLPGDLGEFDIVFAAHVLEHLPRLHILDTIRHWASYLKPGGEMHVFVPDLMWAAKQMAVTEELSLMLLQHIFGSGEDELHVHRMGFSVKILRDLLRLGGLHVQEAKVVTYYIALGSANPAEADRMEKAKQIYAVAVKPREEG
jgi:predicted SAM-dependent methyltransferase